MIIFGIIIGLAIGYFVWNNPSNSSGFLYSTFKVNYAYPLTSSRLNGFVNGEFCENEFANRRQRVYDSYATQVDCYVNNWGFNEITYYNGDDKESYLDEDLFKNIEITCVCKYIQLNK